MLGVQSPGHRDEVSLNRIMMLCHPQVNEETALCVPRVKKRDISNSHIPFNNNNMFGSHDRGNEVHKYDEYSLSLFQMRRKDLLLLVLLLTGCYHTKATYDP